jgi:long-subunit acyl-CoA synthetase (AMP-forming)
MSLTLLTSGTTKAPKEVTHTWERMSSAIQQSIKEIGLRKDDIVLDVFPSNTIAHYTVTAMPAFHAGSKLISAKFEAADYLEKFNQHRPTYIALIPRHWELLRETPNWKNMDMSCVRYMVTGSGPVSQIMIDDFLNKGVKLVANWYGMTEHPPPVFVGYNSECFDFDCKNRYAVSFTSEGECIINGFRTGDIFNFTERKFLKRKEEPTNTKTWKNI